MIQSQVQRTFAQTMDKHPRLMGSAKSTTHGNSTRSVVLLEFFKLISMEIVDRENIFFSFQGLTIGEISYLINFLYVKFGRIESRMKDKSSFKREVVSS